MGKKRTRVVVKKKLADKQSLDSILLAAGTAAGAGIGARRASQRVSIIGPATRGQRINTARQALKSMPMYREDMKRVASANNRIAYGKQTIKDGDVMATKYKRENWMSGPTTGKPRARKEYENVSEYGKSQVAQGMKEKSLADNGMARSRATARGAIQTTLSRMERERVKGNRVRKGAAARKGAVRGGISGFALTSLALLVAKELQKKKD